MSEVVRLCVTERGYMASGDRSWNRVPSLPSETSDGSQLLAGSPLGGLAQPLVGKQPPTVRL